MTAWPQREATRASPSDMEIPMTEQTEPSAEPKPVRPAVQKLLPEEIGGVRGPEPTRYGDWEHKGRCADF
jgi:hypothetical protein